MANLIEVQVPDIGDFKNIPVIEVLVKVGDTVRAEDALVTLESDKATLDVPAPMGGVVQEIRLAVGDKVSQGTVVLTLSAEATAASVVASVQPAPVPPSVSASVSQPAPVTAASASAPTATPSSPAAISQPALPQPLRAAPAVDDHAFTNAHASPSVRRYARELGVDLTRVTGSGPKARILLEDVQSFVKVALTAPGASSATGGGLGFNLPPLANVDFSRFGEIREQPLSRIQKLSGGFLHRNWLSIPHITQHDEVDITDLEAFRKDQSEMAKKAGVKMTLLGFLLKASVLALREFPQFNASLSADGERLILKQYFHVGVAVDTPTGLVVPVIKEVDKKGLIELARELGEVSARMRNGKINPTDLQGGCFSISSLGGIGGTHFTPIINAPEVAILGVGKAVVKPVWNGKDFAPRLMLPLSLSYDHRVIDGALGARFSTFLGAVLSDVRRLAL
jgi:pyruvate dehydrogenase E2 component (dihydrolipoamide acetyltransferase)